VLLIKVKMNKKESNIGLSAASPFLASQMANCVSVCVICYGTSIYDLMLHTVQLHSPHNYIAFKLVSACMFGHHYITTAIASSESAKIYLGDYW